MDVLIRARISDDGRTICVAPGVEMRADEALIATDMPPVPEGLPLVAILFFETETDRTEFVDLMEGDEGVHVREL